MRAATRCVHLGPSDDRYGAISPPIYQTATFRQPTATEFGEYDYTRSGNPTRILLERQLAELEGGNYACAFTSGMAAISAVTRLVKTGEEIIAGDDLYGGTVRLLDSISNRHGIGVCYVDTSDLHAVTCSLSARTRLILVESPSNPLFRISDIRGLSQVARGAKVLLAVDNSMLSPIFQQPLSLGADLVIHSATKFLCGHSDIMAGAVITNDESLGQQIAFTQNAEGAGLSPFDSWLLLRGLKTLALRVERQSETAAKIAQFLEIHPHVNRVFHPNLKRHPGYDTHRGQTSGDGAVVSFTTGDAALSVRIVENTKLFDVAVSFGSVNSTISLPCRMSHASIPESLKHRLAPPSDLVRLSVGIEDAHDLIEDLDRALHVAKKSLRRSGLVTVGR
ncbi:MAG TPA: cystathionine beta-lyase [Pyrinomonadaceae bacterium]|nr:cystathionine beta-lyase [Pyrinomonadaceae bacterium]